ncbi:RNA-directed DNA polymerase, eukaryota, reverse transcriptase zinc-binding domain protein [Tanacetum coccineum]
MLSNKFTDHVMSNLSQNRNDMSSNNEYDGIRVDKDDEVEEIWENSNVMDGEGIECGKKVDHECGDVSDSMMKNVTEEIKKLSKEKNKGVFGWADKEIEECNVTFGSMSKNDVEKELELKQKSRSADNNNVSSKENTFADKVDAKNLDNNLFSIPTSMKDNGDEAIIFDEEIVEEGNKKWVNTVCGYFVGCNMSLAELRNQEGMNTIVDKSPWMVNRKPLMAWSVKGISALASRLGKPLVMDEVTANMRHNGTGRSAYARVLVEIEASKGFKDIIEIQYKDKNNSMIKTKFVKVEYSWRPISCSHCNVFGHSELRCLKSGIKKDQMENNKGIKVNHDSEGFVEVRSRKYGYTRAGKNKGKEQVKANTVVIGKEKNVEELRRSANKYFVLLDEDLNDVENKVIVDRRIEVDRFIKEKKHPSNREIEKYTYDMREYFKYRWKEVCRMENESESEDDFISEENDVTKNLVADEIDGVDTWINVKFFCSFIYASNSGRERQELWIDLQAHKDFGHQRPWVLMGDFNVTLKTNEHSTSGSYMSRDMIDFNECVNNLELEDICSSGFQIRWTKSLKNLNSSIMKKLDRIMINDGFLDLFQDAFGMFLPFVIYDHSPAVITIPKGLKNRKRSFRFVNYISNKREFVDCVSKAWESKVIGCHMYKVVQKLKRLKKPLNILNWKNGNLSDKVTIWKKNCWSSPRQIFEPFRVCRILM